MSAPSYLLSSPAPMAMMRSGWFSSSRIFLVSLSGWKVDSDKKRVLSQLPRYTRHVLIQPCEDVPILTEEALEGPASCQWVPVESDSSSMGLDTWARNRKARSSSSSVRIGTSSHGLHRTCRVFQGNWLSTLYL